jgi:hypothetical protein
VRLVYRHGRRPRVTVSDPPLALRPGAKALLHVYPGNGLCLYYPGQWNHDMLLAVTVLPWTTEWLIRYELCSLPGAGQVVATPTPRTRRSLAVSKQRPCSPLRVGTDC